MKGSPFFVWVLGLVSTQCALNVGRGHGCFILCYRPYVRPRLQCSRHTYGYVFQFAMKGALKALHCILCLYRYVDIGRGVTSDCRPSTKG